MPLFFVLPAALLHVALSRSRRRASIQSLVFLAGFLVVIAPYSAALSRHFGQLTIIDTHGSIHFESQSGRRAPSVLETAQGLVRTIGTHPVQYITGALQLSRSLLYVNGGRILQIYVVAQSKASATAWKVLVHLGCDALLIVSAVFAALGAALCRRPAIAALMLLWACTNIAIASMGGFGGARLRAPFEPLLATLAAVVFAGSWSRAGGAALTAASAAGLLAAVAVLPQVPRSIRSWPDYGVAWPSIFNRSEGLVAGRAGFNVPAMTGLASLSVTSLDSMPARLLVRVNGVHMRTIELNANESKAFRTPWRGGLAFVEIEPEGTTDTRLKVRIDGR